MAEARQRVPPRASRRGRQDAIPAHPDTLRHACGFKLVNDGHDTRTALPLAQEDSPKWRPTTSKTFGGTDLGSASDSPRRARSNPLVLEPFLCLSPWRPRKRLQVGWPGQYQ